MQLLLFYILSITLFVAKILHSEVTKIRNCFSWEDYRLGDVILKRVYRTYYTPRYERWYPGSIASQFLKEYPHSLPWECDAENCETTQKSCTECYLDSFPDEEVFALSKISKNFAIPDENTLVVHMRLGDVFANPDQIIGTLDPVEVFETGLTHTCLECPREDVTNYVKDKKYYDSIPYIEGIKRITFIGSYIHHETAETKRSSLQYVEIMRDYFQKRYPNIPIVWRANGRSTPDSDFAYISNAKHYIKGGGGFSKLVGKIVKTNGGNVYEGN
eukprot:g921.t1